MLKVLLQKFAIIFLFYESVSESKDLLHLFRPKPDLPQELNDFLTDVQHHRKDFAFIRNVAKNQRKYENSYQENHRLFADDIDNQRKINPDYNKNENELENVMPPIHNNLQQRSYDDGGNSISSDFQNSNRYRFNYPEERYSKFIHSPVRLRREMEENYLNQRVQVNSNGQYGNVWRPEPKLSGNQFEDKENKYHTGYLVGVEDDNIDDEEYYQDLKPAEKKKRAVEISIKSDGKLVKHIQEDENGPKSIILNIKSSNSNTKLSEDVASVSSLISSSVATISGLSLSSEGPSQDNIDLNSGPSNSKTIPSLASSNTNRNSIQNKHIGVPINSISAGNNGYFGSNKNSASSSLISKEDPEKKFISKSNNQELSANIQNYNLPDLSKISNTGDFRAKYDQNYVKPLGNNYYRPDSSLGYGDFRWSGENNHMAKSIDMAQNNINGFDGLKEKQPGLDLNLNENRDEFEKVQGLIMDSPSTSDDNKIKEKYLKRQIAKRKRWNEFDKDHSFNENVQTNINNDAIDNRFDYVGPLEQEALNELNMPQQHVQSALWAPGDDAIHLNSNRSYEIIEKSTRDILLIPISYTTECATDLEPIAHNESEQEKEKAAEVIGKAIAEEIAKEEEADEITTECKKEKQAEVIGKVVAEEIAKQEEANEITTECYTDETTEKVVKFEIIRHHEPNVDNLNKQRKNEVQEKIQGKPENAHHHYPRYRNENNQKGKREIARRSNKDKSKKKVVVKKVKGKKPRLRKTLQHSKDKNENSFKLDEIKLDKDAFRDRKHLPTMPKYKRKRVRQHPKKRIERNIDDPSLSDFYDLNAFYDEPDDAFDSLPSFRQRQLKSAAYEFDPNIIQDVGNHEKEEIKKFEKSMVANKKTNKKGKNVEDADQTQGLRKKFKSEGDYADEEDSISASPVKKAPIKKTQNQFALDTHRTTEENDDDYNYSDLTDMEDEDEDIAYEEEEVKGDNLEVDEVAKNNNKNEHENDRVNLNIPKITVSLLKLKPAEVTTQKNKERTAEMDTSSLYDIDDVLLEANEVLASAHSHGHGAPKKKKKKKPPKRETKYTKSVPRNRRAAGAKRRGKRRRKKRFKSNQYNKNGDETKAKGNELTQESNLDARAPHVLNTLQSFNHKKIKPKRQSESFVRSDQNVKDPLKSEMNNNEKFLNQLEEKPLSSQQKQDIFLRYNPDFQRWPRFVQSDNKYHELMRRRAIENQRRYLRSNYNNFPISNEYFLNPRQEFVKRQEPSTAAPDASSESAAAPASDGSSEAPASVASSGSPDGASSAASESASEGGGGETLAEQALNPEGTATLPQAAQNILQTANSDIFENTTAPVMGAVPGPGGANAVEGSTQFQFTTNAEDLTENTQCDTTVRQRMKPCLDENAKHSPVTITSVLPLIPDSATEVKVNITKDQFLDLNEIVAGVLPKHVVSESLSKAKGSVRNSLKAGRYNMNLLLSSYNSSAETNLILNEMTNLMLKLKYHTTCQVLPTNLKAYVKSITKNEMDDPMLKLKEMNEIDFDEHQSNYVFHTGPSDNIQDKAQVLKELLNKYNNLPANCKERAEPVKEYIESHLAMIEHMANNKGSLKSPIETTVVGKTVAATEISSVKPKAKKEIGISDSENTQEDNLEDQIMEEGLKNQKPDANEVIEEHDKKNKRGAEDLEFHVGEVVSTSTSPQFGKLADAVRNVRNRRQSMKRISEIYGNREQVDKSVKQGLTRNEEIGFESPPVINF